MDTEKIKHDEVRIKSWNSVHKTNASIHIASGWYGYVTQQLSW